MKYLAILFAIFATPAFAGSVTITISDPTINGGTPLSKVFTVSSADFATWSGAYRPGCNASINGTCTANQVWNYVAQKAAAQWIADVKTLTIPGPISGTTISIQ